MGYYCLVIVKVVKFVKCPELSEYRKNIGGAYISIRLHIVGGPNIMWWSLFQRHKLWVNEVMGLIAFHSHILMVRKQLHLV